MDLTLALASFGVGIVVGLTGMGGGALMTPVLVLFFNVPPLTAVSSDLVASAVMKPVGSAVHLRRGTVNLTLVKWLCVGSVPSAFAGVLVIRALGRGEDVQHAIKIALGVALLVAAAGLVVRAYVRLVERARKRSGRAPLSPATEAPVPTVRVLPTVVLGAVGGLVVGMTSVGSGSLVIIGLMALYPGLRAGQLVGTDLVQAVPLVTSAAIGHAIFGELDLTVTLPILVGSVPGAWVGAQLSSRVSGGLLRRVLAFVLLACALKTLEVPDRETVIVLAVVGLVAPVLWMAVRRRHGLPALVRSEPGRTTWDAHPVPASTTDSAPDSGAEAAPDSGKAVSRAGDGP